MTLRKVVSTIALCLAVTMPALAQETGDLKIRFEYGGEPVEPAQVHARTNAGFCEQHDLTSEKLLVNPENRGLENVVVYLDTQRTGLDLPKNSAQHETHELAKGDCRFDPHVLILQAGDTLKVTNSDPIVHNPNLHFFRNDVQNFMIAPGGSSSVKLERAEPAPMPVDCNIHPWMRAYIVVLEHSFAAKSDENGNLLIEGLPVGKKLTFRVFHEAGRVEEVMVNSQQQSWRRSRFQANLESGINDLGTVVIPAEILTAD